MIPILLKNSRIALVDDIDADLVKGITWSLSKDYLARKIYASGKTIQVKLHRLILERKLGRPIGEGMVTDHINRNRCDNRRENLRESTYSENWENSIRADMVSDGKTKNPSGYKGVLLDPDPRVKIKRWKVILSCKGKRIYLGHYETVDQAIAARRDGIIKYGLAPQ